VTVAAGATTANFAITTNPVTTATAVTITATYNGVAKTATLNVNPAGALAALTVNPTAVTGGTPSTGTVTLNAAAPAGGVNVTLTSNNVNATVPVSVTVGIGATTANFAITTKPVTRATAATITATYNGVAKAATLTLNPPNSLAGVAFNPAVVIFPSFAVGTVTLTSAAPAGGAIVALTSTNTSEFYLPDSVTVPAGATTANFNVGTALFASTTTITATYNGVAKAAILTSVDPTVVAMACNPNPVISGTTTICTVTMNGIMPVDTPVFVLSDQPFYAPASGTLTVPAGASAAAFSINTAIVPSPIVAHISADALGTATVTANLTLNLTNRGKKWVLNNVVFKDGGTATGYFTFDQVTGTYLDVNIQTTPGNDPNSPLGLPPSNFYYYPDLNSFYPTVLDNWSMATVLSVQDPAGPVPTDPSNDFLIAYTLLQLNFAQALTNAGGTIPLVVDPNVFYTPTCVDLSTATCTPPPGNISQELFALPPGITVFSGYNFRVIISGSVTAQ
jgi:hypothetical protein